MVILISLVYRMSYNAVSLSKLEKVIFGPQTIKFKRVNPRAQSPENFHSADEYGNLGADLRAVSRRVIHRNGVMYLEYNTGLAFEAPYPMGLFAFPRSSVSKVNSMLSNSVGVIDRNYRGEVLALFKVDSGFTEQEVLEAIAYQPNDRVIQLVCLIAPGVRYKENDELSDTERGSDGIGSTGNS